MMYRDFPYTPCFHMCTDCSIINFSHWSGTFVTTDEPIVTCNHPKSIVIQGSFLVVYFYMFRYVQCRIYAFQVVLEVNNPPANAGNLMWVRSLGWEDPLEEGMETHSSILAWRILVDRGAWKAIVHRVTQNWAWLKQLSMHTQWHISIIMVLYYFHWPNALCVPPTHLQLPSPLPTPKLLATTDVLLYTL